MRILFAACLAGWIAASGASAQERPQERPWAEKMFKDGVTHDFGSIPRGTQLFHRFKITNIYAVPLQVMRLQTSCGCVHPSTDVKVLQPRESGFIDVSMDASKFEKQRTVSVQVDIGPEYVSSATLKVSAVSRTDVVVNPGEVEFGIVQPGQSPTKTIEVEYAGRLDWKAELAKHSESLNVTVEEMYRRPGQVGYRVKMTVKPDAPPGSLKQEVVLKTNDGASPFLPILVEAVVQAPLTASPEMTDLGNVKAGEEVSKRVVVKASSPFQIVAIDGLGNDMKAAVSPPGPASVHVVTISCKPTTPGDLRRQLVFKTDLGNESAVTVRLAGTATP